MNVEVPLHQVYLPCSPSCSITEFLLRITKLISSVHAYVMTKGKEDVFEKRISMLLIQNITHQLWELIPNQARAFLQKPRHSLAIKELAEFWSTPTMIRYTRRRDLAEVQAGASWAIASQYLKLGMTNKAISLTLNGSFFHQCHVSVVDLLNMMCTFTFV